jgi:serine/threonine protein kinase
MSTDLQPNAVLANRYRIVERIGKGGMAEVFRGMDHVLEREVAVKVLTNRSDDVCRRFLMEAQSMARLNHPNIVAVYDVGVDRSLSYIILEYVRGRTLREMDRKTMPLETALALILQLLEALQYAHDQGIIHRDIKPGNLMVSDDNVLKVMDFGLARRMSDMSNLTQSGHIVGTLAYLPPERFLGKSGDKASDLYSVGVLLYELLCGRLPFALDSSDLAAVMYAHVNDRPKPPRLQNPLIPPALDRIVMRLLEKEPAKRYGDAATLIQDLRAVQAALRTPAGRATVLDENTEQPTVLQPATAGQPASEETSQSLAAEPSEDRATGRFATDEFVTSKTFTAALTRVMQGMMCARKQQWREAEDHYVAAIGMLAPMKYPTELARTYARLGALYCAKMKATGVAPPSEVAAAREYLTKALPVLRERRLSGDVKEAEANLQALESLPTSA